MAERFCFCLNTALSDIAFFCPEYKSKIINDQIELIEEITNSIIEYNDKTEVEFSDSGMLSCFLTVSTSKSNLFSLVVLCRQLLPIFLGFCRSVGRCPSKNDVTDSLFLKLFPRHNAPPKCDMSQETPNEYESFLYSVNTRRPMSKSSSSNSSELKSNSRKDSSPYEPQENNLWEESDNFHYCFFYKFGSNFDIYINNFSLYFQTANEFKKNFGFDHVTRLFHVFKSLLHRDVINTIDDIATRIHSVRISF